MHKAVRVGCWFLVTSAFVALALMVGTVFGVVIGAVFNPPVGRLVGYDSNVILPEVEEFYTLKHFFQSGHNAAKEYLADRSLPERQSMERALSATVDACVRVRAILPEDDDNPKTSKGINGTGVLAGNGEFVITASHVVADVEHCRIAMTDGTVYDGTPVFKFDVSLGDANPKDLAVIQLVSPAPHSIAVHEGDLEVGEVVCLMGYPGALGINSEGVVVEGHLESEEEVEPILLIAEVTEVADELTMAPIAGSWPIGGLSGGPILDAKGRMRGVFWGKGKSRSKGKGTRDWRYQIMGASLASDAGKQIMAVIRGEAKDETTR